MRVVPAFIASCSARGGELSATASDVDRLTRRGLRLAQFTVGYNLLEGILATVAGAAAALVSLIGFGVDSGIESFSAVLVAVRLSARLRSGRPDEARERMALRLVSGTFFLLAAYVTVDGILSLMSGEQPGSSVLGLFVLGASLVVMPLLAAAKRRVGLRLGDNLILADAAETRICVLLSVSTFAGLALFELTGAAWVDPVAGFVLAAFAVHEGIEAWHGELAGDDGD
ncbi:MAG: cation transporter [Actinomycetota bacterium]|nr:cation transporter [Actinomycetota bacterium]